MFYAVEAKVATRKEVEGAIEVQLPDLVLFSWDVNSFKAGVHHMNIVRYVR